MSPEHECYDEKDKYRISEPVLGRGVSETESVLLLCLSMNPRNDVLHDAQRTDHRAVYPAEKKRDQQQYRYCHEVKRQHCRQQLYLGHPSQPGVKCSCEIEEQQSHTHKEDGCQNNSDFS